MQSQLSVDTGCSDSYKDVLAIEAGETPRTASPPHPRPVAAGALACTYDVASDLPEGRLRSGRQLTDDEVARLDRGLATATVDATCTRTGHTAFAVVSTSGSGVVVALDGCAVQQDSRSWRVGDDVRRLLSVS